MPVDVLAKDGQRLMPTQRLGKVRRMLKDGRAVIASRNPFTIQLTYETTHYTQPEKLCARAAEQRTETAPGTAGADSAPMTTQQKTGRTQRQVRSSTGG